MSWLDESGKEIGRVDRHVAHWNGLFHPVVHVWVVNAKQEILLQQRGKHVPAYPLFWDSSVGGHVDWNESLNDAAQREMHEEIGLRGKLRYVGYADAKDEQKIYSLHERVHLYMLRLSSTKSFSIQKGEVSRVEWVNMKDISPRIKKNNFTPTFVAIWKKFGKKAMKL